MINVPWSKLPRRTCRVGTWNATEQTSGSLPRQSVAIRPAKSAADDVRRGGHIDRHAAVQDEINVPDGIEQIAIA
jgi:hypothetical protein